jgi:hypothetical protein
MDYAVPDIANSYSDSYVSHDAFINDYDYDEYDYSKCGGDILLDAGYKRLDARQREETCRGYKPSARAAVEAKPRGDLPPLADYPDFRDKKLRPKPYAKVPRNPPLVQGFYDGIDPRELIQGFRSGSKRRSRDMFLHVLIFIVVVYLVVMCVAKSIEVRCLKRMLMMEMRHPRASVE